MLRGKYARRPNVIVGAGIVPLEQVEKKLEKKAEKQEEEDHKVKQKKLWVEWARL